MNTRNAASRVPPPRQLAILGGAPLFEKPLHVGRPNIVNRARFKARLNDMLNRGWLTNNGPLVQEFERRIAEYVGTKHCIAVCNATVGLELAIRAAGLRGEVIIPSYTFIATAHALQWQEITPVFADIDPSSHTLDAAQIARHVTPRTTGIIGTHLWGKPCNVAALSEVARDKGLVLLFDAAHAFGCSYLQKKIGGFGLAEVFSFHATKFLNSFEGGAITTNDDKLAEKVRLMKNFGFSGYDNVVYLGTNGKMTEVCAAMGLTNLDVIDRLISINLRNYKAYAKNLKSVPGVRLLAQGENGESNYQYIVIEVDESIATLTRDELIEVLHAERVLARKYFWPGCHNMEPYRSKYPGAMVHLPETERLSARVIVLPTGASVGTREITQICSRIGSAFVNAGKIRVALKKKHLPFLSSGIKARLNEAISNSYFHDVIE